LKYKQKKMRQRGSHRRGSGGGSLPLTMVEKGRKVRITSILCGQGLRHRLGDISLYEGAVVEVIRNDATGPVILKVLDSRVVVGRGQANKIMVNPI